MWLLRLLRSFHGNFAIWLMALLIAEGLFGLVMMFIFPPISLAMVFLGLISLALAIVIKALLGSCIDLLARILGEDSTASSGTGTPTA